ncbi:hypothetical protein [Lactiplantibacillus daowaiensis]|uniref:Uncharacterized protein n=1 Tax=Lactiplantibacillus daowaiensis TaxID=2559918 RepID=A0ABW1S1X7_9LACO|nr:hypothetical protein [Lactiplantibacillus daowaiensis]
MSKPIMPKPKGTVQVDLATFQQWQHFTRLLTEAQSKIVDQQVAFDVTKLTTALTYGLQLSDSSLTAKVVGCDGQAEPQSVVSGNHYTLWPRIDGGVDLVEERGSIELKKGTLTEKDIRQSGLVGGDVVTAVIDDAKHVSAVKKVNQVPIETDLVTLSRATVENGDILGLAGRLVVTHNSSTTITDPSGMPYPYVIPQPIVDQFHVRVDDSVDLRWYRDELLTIRLIWKY